MLLRATLTAAATLALAGLFGTVLVFPANARAEPVVQACQPSNLLGNAYSEQSCKMGWWHMYHDTHTNGPQTVFHNDPNSLTTNQNGSLCQTYLTRDIGAYTHPGGVFYSAPDYLTGCEAAKRQLMAEGYP
jgi:hypothetical protein